MNYVGCFSTIELFFPHHNVRRVDVLVGTQMSQSSSYSSFSVNLVIRSDRVACMHLVNILERGQNIEVLMQVIVFQAEVCVFYKFLCNLEMRT